MFTAIEHGKTKTHCFTALGVETKEKIKLLKNKIRFDF